ncbi:MAG: glutamate synthase subunit beta [Zoogloeaceae bacterium]|jgi:glutamate synthase (NADPH/NADH) small chain|nr:glutamate synthase subunit beta [Zoogloeaceae bacterium]
MGKPTGFLEFERLSEGYQSVEQRVRHFREFVAPLSDADAGTQGARCMDCGTPFCNNGCPVNNIVPDWNDFVFRGAWEQALAVLHSTNNFPDFTGRICPAPCEAACTLGINAAPVGIRSIEHAIIDKGWERGWIKPQPAALKTGKKVAVVGSGPAGLAAAQQLARIGHAVTVFEKNNRIGGLLRYGIPDFKLEKKRIDARVAQMEAEGVTFRPGVLVGIETLPSGIACDAKETVDAGTLKKEFDAVVLAGGAETPRDLPIPGRALRGVHFALEFLIPQNREVAGDGRNPINARGKHVIVIGGGDTGSDCVGVSNRQGAASVTQLELMPEPPLQEDKALAWPYWPHKKRTSSSHEEGCERLFSVATRAFIEDSAGQVRAARIVDVTWKDGKMSEVAGSARELPADLVFLAMGFTHPIGALLDAFGVEKDARGNANAVTEGDRAYATDVEKVFVAGDLRRGQSLVVWAIREGRQCARAVDEFLMGSSLLPR